jgi:hypothetical protein
MGNSDRRDSSASVMEPAWVRCSLEARTHWGERECGFTEEADPMKSLRAMLLLLPLLAAPGCLFANFKTTLDEDFDKTSLGPKRGEASAQAFLWLVAFGDAGTQAAAEEGQLAIVNHADKEILSVLFGLYYKETTIVYGE